MMFFFQEASEINGIQMPIQCYSMFSCDHNGAISMDATFDTNDMKFHVFHFDMF